MHTIKSHFANIEYGTILIILFTVIQIYHCHAQQPVLRDRRAIQDYRYRTNQNRQIYPAITGYRLIDTLKMSQQPQAENRYLNQTYVFQSDDKKIARLNPSFYSKLDSKFQSTYTKDDIKLIPEIFVNTGSTPGSQYIYRIGFESRLPIRYQFSSKQFEGTMKFFLLCDASLGNYALSEPVLIEVVSNDIGSIKPESKEIDHISLPSTDLELQDPELSDSAQVKIITRSNPEGYETYLPVDPVLLIDSTRTTLQGLGVQKIPISIRVIGSSLQDSVEVSFNVDKGAIEPNAIYVQYNRPSTVYLRSEGLGHATLTASSVLRSNGIKLNYKFPWIFILMAIIGGTLGGMVKYFTDPGKLNVINSILRGALLGIFGSVVYYVLGFSLIKFEVSDIFNEFAVLGFSALVAYFGVQIGN